MATNLPNQCAPNIIGATDATGVASHKQVYEDGRFAKTETGTGSTLTRETVRDPSASFALLTGCGMTVRDRYSEAICGTC